MAWTKFVVGVSMCAIVAALASYPVGAQAQLSMMGGAALAPKMNTGSLAGGQKAIKGAKDDKAKADARAQAVNELMEDDGGQAGKPDLSKLDAKVYSASELIQAVSAQGSEKMTGTPVRAEGVVLKVSKSGGTTTVFLGAPTNPQGSPVFAFRFEGERDFAEGSPQTMEGRFGGRMKMDGIPNDIYIVYAQGAGNSEGAAASSAEPEKVEPFDGWKFVGSVEAEGGATGVFVKEGKTLYAQPGDHLSDDVVVVRMKVGEAVLSEAGKASVVSPW